MNRSRTLARSLTIAISAIAALALFASSASAREPAPGLGQFAGCPSPEENPTTTLCLRSVITGGHFKMGSKDVPIENPITLSGGVNESTGKVFASPKGGLTPVKQKVPGGVIGLTGLTWLLELLGSEALTLYAVTELAGQPSNVTFGTVTLPIKVHLVNSTLGNNCYVGSVSNPIVLNLTVGTTSPPPPNKPITGKEPEVSVTINPEIIHADKGTYVDNSFAAPGASGCVLTLFGFIPISINGLVNSQSGLPAAAGTNETVQNFNAEIAGQSTVYP